MYYNYFYFRLVTFTILQESTFLNFNCCLNFSRILRCSVQVFYLHLTANIPLFFLQSCISKLLRQYYKNFKRCFNFGWIGRDAFKVYVLLFSFQVKKKYCRHKKCLILGKSIQLLEFEGRIDSFSVKKF